MGKAVRCRRAADTDRGRPGEVGRTSEIIADMIPIPWGSLWGLGTSISRRITVRVEVRVRVTAKIRLWLAV